MAVTSEVHQDEEPGPRSPLQVETIRQLADRLRLGETRIRELMAEGLPSIKLGRSRRFITVHVDAWLIDQAEASSGAVGASS